MHTENNIKMTFYLIFYMHSSDWEDIFVMGNFQLQWRSSAPKSGGGGHKLFYQKVKKKPGHCGVKAHDRGIVDRWMFII